jgi:hypothetical protein
MVEYITIDDREQIFNATLTLLTVLKNRIDGRLETPNSDTRERERDVDLEINLNSMLFKRLWRAAILCPGFSPTMKDTIAYKCQVNETLAQELGVPLFAADWKYLWTIGPKPGAPHDLILVSDSCIILNPNLILRSGMQLSFARPPLELSGFHSLKRQLRLIKITVQNSLVTSRSTLAIPRTSRSSRP